VWRSLRISGISLSAKVTISFMVAVPFSPGHQPRGEVPGSGRIVA
jgi:hypothetical protein